MEYMRKCFVVPMIIVASFFADVCAFGATARGSRSIANAGTTAETTKSTDISASSENQAVSARVAVRNTSRNVAKSVGTMNAAAGKNLKVGMGDPIMQTTSARVAVRNTSKNVAKSVGNMNAAAGKNLKVGVGDPIMQTTSARAATKQKAVNMGTKITTATENTVVPEECRTAFDGCMDSFCMLANTSGGRCRCDDRSEELDNVLDQIMKLDSQSKTLAEEGVERLQRGDAVDAIYSMAEDAANKVVADQKKNQKDFLDIKSKSSSSSKKLDMSMFNSGVFDTDDLFGGLDDNILESDLSDKKGDALRSAATKMCVAKVPSQCKEYSSMLQLVYAQKIKSDCIAYENDLKQQKMNSENLLKTAQKAVRDAAAEAYESKNKYKTTGECVIAFKQCMLGEDVCGSGFSKCVIDPTLVSDNASKPYTIKTSKSITVEITASTYGALNSSRSFCDNVLAQCVDANKNDAVWKQFLVNVAPELKAAEYNAEDESRRNCANNVISCIKERAATEGFTEGSDSWYIFTSNPDNVENFCGGELRKCSAYDETGEKGTMYQAVMSFVNLSLNALRADRCTTTIKKCLQDSCGEDYSECLGFTVNDLKTYCPKDVIEADCAGGEASSANNVGFKILRFNNDDDLYNYVNQVAQGLFLSVDNALQKACLNAVNTAMATYCGSTTSCSSSNLDFSGIIDTYLEITTSGSEGTDPLVCDSQKTSLTGQYTSQWIKVNMSSPIGPFVSTYGKSSNRIDSTVAKLNETYKTLVGFIENDPNVSKCKNGASYKDFAGLTQGGSGNKTQSFANLTSNTKSVVAQSIYDTFLTQFSARVEELNVDVDDKNKEAKDSVDGCKGKYALILVGGAIYPINTRTALNAFGDRVHWVGGTWQNAYDSERHYWNACNTSSTDSHTLRCDKGETPLIKLDANNGCPTGMQQRAFNNSNTSWITIANVLKEHFNGVNTNIVCYLGENVTTE